MAGRLMRAVVYEGYGGGAAKLKHVEVPIPPPKKDEVLLKMEATSVNPFDWTIQTGRMRPILPFKFPYIPGIDAAAEVIEVGEGVQNLKAGDKVVSVLSFGGGGGFSEYAVASKALTVKRPPEVSAAEGVGLPIAGGVGHYAVQLAKLGNAHVTVTCGARNADFLKSLGADEILDYNTAEGAAHKSPSGKTYDYVIHCATGIPFSTFEPNLSKNGKVIDLTPGPRTMLNFVFQNENLEYLIGLVKQGKLKTIMDSKYPLDKAEEAWAKSIEGHATGKIIVEH
ncbi:hypothetical protein MKW94_015537 [Papaver nudicaule]|uniref:Enoyl reductase (ER) domain-containing protein n=1 Tax=Papaver nudicaule TaxID=74823 RepID=A0AA41VGM6_PAPNU|nr:hypothetical protein [Papaver nudicaule]